MLKTAALLALSIAGADAVNQITVTSGSVYGYAKTDCSGTEAKLDADFKTTSTASVFTLTTKAGEANNQITLATSMKGASETVKYGQVTCLKHGGMVQIFNVADSTIAGASSFVVTCGAGECCSPVKTLTDAAVWEATKNTVLSFKNICPSPSSASLRTGSLVAATVSSMALSF